MAKPFVRYKTDVKTVMSGNNDLDYYRIYIYDKLLVGNLNYDFECIGSPTIDYPTNDNAFDDVFFGSRLNIPFAIQTPQDEIFLNLLISDQEERFFIEVYKVDPFQIPEPFETIFWRGVVNMDEVQHENKERPFLC